jgi:Spx/MgsR family transcriptional regulator
LQKKVVFNERDFFKNPFTIEEIKMILEGNKPDEMFSFRSPSFKELSLEQDRLTDEHLIELMAKEPRLIRRPIVRINGKVHFGASMDTLKKIL